VARCELWHHRRVNHARSLVIAGVMTAASPAAATCPTQPDDAVCRPWSAMLMPAAFGVTYSPRGISGTYVGGGFEAVLLAWSDNSEAFGPSQGRTRFDIAVLDSVGDEPALGTMVMYRLGAQVAFERNASRSVLIPYFTVDLGGLWTDVSRTRWFADGGVGIYLVHRRNVIVDVEATAVLPFKDPGEYAGVRTRLGVSFSLW
jgi:hypothetical protein